MSSSGHRRLRARRRRDAARGHGVCARLGAARRRPRRERRADCGGARRREARRGATSPPLGPPIAEVEAIGRAIAFAEDTGCALHVVHVSAPRGRARGRARARGVDVTCETCPHYLLLDEDDLERSAPSRSARRRCATGRDRAMSAPSSPRLATSSPPTTPPPRPTEGRPTTSFALGRDRRLPVAARCSHSTEGVAPALRPRALRSALPRPAGKGADRARSRRRPRARRPVRRDRAARGGPSLPPSPQPVRRHAHARADCGDVSARTARRRRRAARSPGASGFARIGCR